MSCRLWDEFRRGWDAQCASVPMLTGTAAVSTRLSEAAVLLSVVKTPTVSTRFVFFKWCPVRGFSECSNIAFCNSSLAAPKNVNALFINRFKSLCVSKLCDAPLNLGRNDRQAEKSRSGGRGSDLAVGPAAVRASPLQQEQRVLPLLLCGRDGLFSHLHYQRNRAAAVRALQQRTGRSQQPGSWRPRQWPPAPRVRTSVTKAWRFSHKNRGNTSK